MIRWGQSAMLAALVALAPAAAFAQGTAPSQGPMTIEQIHDGFAASGGVKLGNINGEVSTLVGGEAGWLAAEHLFIGGGGYGMVHGASNSTLGYGGFVMGWIQQPTHVFGFAAKILLGGGSGNITYVVQYPVAIDPRTTVTRNTLATVNEDFFIAEPEGDLLVRMSKHVSLTAGVSFRATVTGHYDYYYGFYSHPGDDRLHGFSGVIGFTFR